jgi:hypothetical protein
MPGMQLCSVTQLWRSTWKLQLAEEQKEACRCVLLAVTARNLLSKPKIINYLGFSGRRETPWQRIRTDERSKVIYPCNRLCRPIGLWYFEDPIFSRQLVHRWWRDFQTYAPAVLNSPGRFPILVRVRCRVNPRAITPLEELGTSKKSTTFRLVAQSLNQLRYRVHHT